MRHTHTYIRQNLRFYLVLVFGFDIGKSVIHSWGLKVKMETFERKGIMIVKFLFQLG